MDVLFRRARAWSRLACLVAFGAATAQEPTSVERAADLVLAAVGDAEHLGRIARPLVPDRWLVADELCRRGKYDAALAMVAAARTVEVERLAAYVEARRTTPASPEVRAALDVAIAARAPRDGIDPLEAVRGRGDAFEQARVLLRLADGYAAAGRVAESVAAYRKGAEGAEALGWLGGAVRGWMRAGLMARRVFDYDGMRSSWERLRAIQERRSRDGLAAVLMNLGSLDAELGAYDRARANYARALAILEEMGLGAGVRAADILGNLGYAEFQQGAYRNAQATFERVIDLLRKSKATGNLAIALLRLADVHNALGDYTQALANATEARMLLDGLVEGARASAPWLPHARTTLAKCLGVMGGSNLELGRHEVALAQFAEAQRVFAESGNQRGVALSLCSISLAHARTKDFRRALEAGRESHRMIGRIPDPWLRAQVHLALARAYQGLEQFEHAERHAMERLKLAREIGSVRHEAGARLDLARAALAQARPTTAVEHAGAAVEGLGTMLVGLAEEQSAEARADNAEYFEVAVRASLAAKDEGALARFLESGRAAALLESLEGRPAIRAAAVPEELRRHESEARIAEAAAQAKLQRAHREGKVAEVRRRREELAAARARLLEVVRRIQRSTRARVLYPRPADVWTLQSALQADEGLVLYALLQDVAAALVLTPREVRVVKLENAAAIRASCAALRPEDRSVDPAPAEALRRQIVKPLALDARTRCLIVSPDSDLFEVPFCALTARRVAYVPSGTTLRWLRAARRAPGSDVLALGDPDYVGRPWPPLPASRSEALAVGTKHLLGKAATEAGLRAALVGHDQWRALHFACHGRIDPRRPMFSALALTADGADDGSLTTLEVFGMSVPADLVVLSACETGRGRVYPGEGLVGMTRAFMFAGASRVLVSLWKVDDRATRALMEKFYAQWRLGASAAEALAVAQASVRLRAEWKHPYYWAAWQLWGLPD